MKILAVLQNAYSYKPLDREISPEVWFRLMCRCTTGKRLAKVFESMPEMLNKRKNGLLLVIDSTNAWGVGVSSRLKPDLNHLQTHLQGFKPDLVLTCGLVAEGALRGLWKGNLVCIPHPASRTLTNDLLISANKYIAALETLDSTMPVRVAFRQNRGSHSIEYL
jgi:hypothetical protein